ncbi:unnamed protein product [Medioppia subpectinata]|uniref:Methyltransferase domain-containing protein n=1 Tax=Medioppia subpectinata TaxID=1979941 RepID=A0A7R9Q195_9ACAR|nr:unnamed protein product [Medioppia subpectinata]CAG2108849.1 unnamed protein product [Medioppia subpectinata]
MLEIAKQKNCYTNLINSLVTKDIRLPIEDKTYDVVIMAGCLCPGHIRWNSFPQIIRVVKTDARILDIGMGTGNVGIHLKQNGYTNIDGLDASPEMVEIAKQRNCYKNLICSSVEKETRLPIEDKTYDVVIMAGCLCPGHIRWNSFPQIIRIVKTGGVVFWFVAVSKTFEEKDEDFRNGNNENLVKSLTTEGKWDYINGYPKRVENYMIGTEGDIYAMKVQ